MLFKSSNQSAGHKNTLGQGLGKGNSEITPKFITSQNGEQMSECRFECRMKWLHEETDMIAGGEGCHCPIQKQRGQGLGLIPSPW